MTTDSNHDGHTGPLTAAHSVAACKPAHVAVPDEGWAPPIPLDAHGLDLPAFPVGALPSALRPWVEAEAEAVQVPADLVAFCALGTVAACVQGRAVAEVRPGWSEALGLYCFVAMPSASRKSGAFRDAVAPLAELQDQAAAEMAGEIREARALRRVAEKRLERAERTAARADATGQAPEAEVRAAVQALELVAVPAAPRWLIDDATPEALTLALAAQGGALALMSAEADGLVTSMGRYSEEANLGPLLAGHTGERFSRDRVAGGSLVIPRATMTVCIAAQPVTLAMLAPHAGRGLPARMLFALPDDRLGRRRDDGAPVPANVANGYRGLIRRLAELPAHRDATGMLEPAAVPFSPGARRIFEGYHAILEPRLAGDLVPIQAWAGKLRGQLVRIATLFHVVGAEDYTEPVTEEAAAQAMCLADYLIAHSFAAHASMGASEAQRDAATVLRAVRRSGNSTATEREILRLCRGLDRKRRDAALDVLVERGHLRCIRIDHPPGGGPPTVVFEVHPGTIGTNDAGTEHLSRLSLPPASMGERGPAVVLVTGQAANSAMPAVEPKAAP
ncbi:MAG: DUF3987 domain-containing protein [Deltaproteobacteria bacterium]|nr:DUF3987 domain-containing protein [Deltaproteobacteria bacterium]